MICKCLLLFLLQYFLTPLQVRAEIVDVIDYQQQTLQNLLTKGKLSQSDEGKN